MTGPWSPIKDLLEFLQIEVVVSQNYKVAFSDPEGNRRKGDKRTRKIAGQMLAGAPSCLGLVFFEYLVLRLFHEVVAGHFKLLIGIVELRTLWGLCGSTSRHPF